MDIVNLITILVKLHFQAFRNEFANENETILHFGNMKNLNDGCKQHSISNLQCGLDVPFANGLQNGVISHVHHPWNNGFISGEPLLFKCHVLCCVGIDDPIIHCMIISTQSDNKHLFFIFHKLGFLFLSHHSSSSNNYSQSAWVFYNKKKLFVYFMSFVEQCDIFHTFIFFFLEAS